MRYFKLLATLLLMLGFVNAYAHKDRIEKPGIYVFYFGKERVEIKSSEKTRLESYNNLIVSKKKKLTHANIVFATGETISFQFVDYKCMSIEIEYMKRTRAIPNSKAKKIPGINFLSVSLLWSGEKPQAFDSEYFCIRFLIGNSELPYLEFFFDKHKFTESIIWNKVGEKSSQWKKF